MADNRLLKTGSRRPPPLPRLPAAPRAYDQGYFAELIRELDNLIAAVYTEQEAIVRTLNIHRIPVTGYALRTGDVFRDGDGFLHIAEANKGYMVGLSVSLSLGTVTVSTP